MWLAMLSPLRYHHLPAKNYTMTRKDYVLIADAIASVMQNVSSRETETVDSLIRTLSTAFKRDNPRFDAMRFAAACWCEGQVKGYQS